MTLARRAARNFATQAASFVVTIADRVILVGLLIRAWGPDAYSDWATLMATVGLLVISEFGFQTVLGNLLTLAEVRGHARAFQRIVRLGLFFYLSLSALLIVGIVLMFLFADLASALNLTTLRNANSVFLILAMCYVVKVARSGAAQILRGKGEVHRLIAAEVRSSGGAVLLSALAVLGGAGPITIAWIYLSSELVFGTGLAVWDVRRRYGSIRLAVQRPTLRELRATGGDLRWYGWLALANNLMNHMPVLVIAWLGLSGPLLISFVVQRTLVNVGKTFTTALSIALGVEVARARDQDDGRDFNDGVSMLARVNAAFAALTVSGLICFGPHLIGIWTGRGELASYTIMLWLLLPIVVTAPAIPLQMLTMFGGLPRPQALACGIQAALGLPLAVAAGLIYGVSGVAFGVAFGEVVGIGMVLPLLAGRKLGVAYRSVLKDSAILFAAAIAWAGAWGALLVTCFPPANAAQLGALLVAWGVTSAAPILVISLPPSFRTKLRAALVRTIAGRKA